MILPHVQVDKGAIKFVLSGANIMCPGLTSPGARMDTALPDNSIVVSSYIVLPCCTNYQLSPYSSVAINLQCEFS